MKFIPAFNSDPLPFQECWNAWSEFARRLRWSYLFHDAHDRRCQHASRFHVRTGWDPLTAGVQLDDGVEHFLSVTEPAVLDELALQCDKHVKSNLSRLNRQALSWLYENRTFCAIDTDLTIFRLGGGKFGTSMYRKPIIRCPYPNPRSEHPSQCYRFIRAETLRILRNSSRESDFDFEVCFFIRKLVARGYSYARVVEQTSSVRFQDQGQLIQQALGRITARRANHDVRPPLEYSVPFVLRFSNAINYRKSWANLNVLLILYNLLSKSNCSTAFPGTFFDGFMPNIG